MLTSGRPAPPLGGQGSPASWSSPSVSDLSPDLRHQGPPGKFGGPPFEFLQGWGWDWQGERGTSGLWEGHGAHAQSHFLGTRHQLRAKPSQCPTPPTLRPREHGAAAGREGGARPGSLTPRLSLSVDTDKSRYPQKLAFAECLCRGCISAKTGRETAALNSVPLVQSLLVLRRRPCSRDAAGVPTPGAFTFHTEFIRVPVGCTCVLPRSAR